MIIPDAVHTDLYDQTDIIPFDKLTAFFQENDVIPYILRWNLQKGVVVIPGSGNPDHIQEK